MSYFEKVGFQSHGVINVTPSDCYRLLSSGVIIVDIRELPTSNFKTFDVREVICVPYCEIKTDQSRLPADKALIIADSVGLKSRECCLYLQEKGFKEVANLAGGIFDWERDGLPLKTDTGQRLSGSCMCQLRKIEGGKG